MKIFKAECGSSVSMNGTIVNDSLTYTFKPCTHCRSLKDVCNYIYFQGDTLCFSIQCNQNITNATIEAYFENPLTNTTYKAERIEIVNDTVYGFSLVGSLLEKIYYRNCYHNYSFKKISLPFTVHILISLNNQKIHHTLSDTIHIQFTQ